MANPRKTRGEYRPVYVAMFHGKDYRALSANAKLVLLTIKGTAGAAGLQVWPALNQSLAEMTGLAESPVRRAVVELITADWIEYEDGILWLVRGLEFEPQMSHGEKHRKWIKNLISGLPRSPIVDRFRARYWEFFGNSPPIDSKEPIEGLPLPHTIPVHSPQSLSQSPSLSAVVVPDNDHDSIRGDVVLLTTAANAGIEIRYGSQPNPIHYGHAGGIPMVEALRAAGVDMEFAHAVVFAYASTMQKEDPPRSLKYFTGHVIERWNIERARSDAAQYKSVPAPSAPEIDQMKTFAIRYANDGSSEWQSYCDARGYEWKTAA